MVDATNNYPAVIGYEPLANECSLETPGDSDCGAFTEYVHTVANWLRQRTDKLLLSASVSTRNVFRDPEPGEPEQDYARARRDFAVDLYSALDAGSVHYYLGDESKSYVRLRHRRFAEIDKPYFVTHSARLTTTPIVRQRTIKSCWSRGIRAHRTCWCGPSARRASPPTNGVSRRNMATTPHSAM